jgi:hypothetical protein
MNKKIYIPTNVKTGSYIFDGFGMSELGKTILMTLIVSGLSVVIYLFTKNLAVLVLTILITISACISIFTKDRTNQSVVDYVENILKFSKRQKRYLYNNRMDVQIDEFIKNAKK